MIEFSHVSKTFQLKNSTVEALKDVSLTIDDHDIYGVIGFSGAGKSTLVRCINALERPTAGIVRVDGVDINALDNKALRDRRVKIGMIFQQFNLFASRTVYDNVAFALKNTQRHDIKQRVEELLDLVGIPEKALAYPSQLSGGQKQRVAIARALANDPDILLCDEATSALDPQTTDQILGLLKEVNARLGITIVVITHEMRVIKDLCHHVAVMDDGMVVEEGKVFDLFAHPQQAITKNFIKTTNNIGKIEELIQQNSALVALRSDEQILRINFQGVSTGEPLISKISRDFNVNTNIIFGNVEIIDETPIGSLVVILQGDSRAQQAALKYLHDEQVDVEVLKS